MIRYTRRVMHALHNYFIDATKDGIINATRLYFTNDNGQTLINPTVNALVN